VAAGHYHAHRAADRASCRAGRIFRHLSGHLHGSPLRFASVKKLHHNAALDFPYAGPKPHRGPTPRYGAKLDYAALPAETRCQTVINGRYQVDTYQLTLLHKDFPDPLNVVIVVKTDRRTHRRGHVVLFSTDLTLTGLQLVDYYSLRFQIEFNFRDARQYWGLEDFMYVSPRAVTNAVNLAFLMVNLSSLLMRPFRQRQPQFSILDLKAHYRAQRYLHETIKLVPGSPDPSFLSELARKVLSLGAIHASQHFQAAACLAQVLFYPEYNISVCPTTQFIRPFNIS
jgi:putative transposase